MWMGLEQLSQDSSGDGEALREGRETDPHVIIQIYFRQAAPSWSWTRHRAFRTGGTEEGVQTMASFRPSGGGRATFIMGSRDALLDP